MFFKIAPYLRIQIFIAACLNLCELINGYAVSWPGVMLVKFDDPNQSPLACTLTDVEKYWLVEVTFLGFVGTFLSGYLANRIGRKKSIIIGATLHLISYLLLALARNLATVIIGRFLVGFSFNFLMVLAAIYIGEIASPNIRGVILSSIGVSHATGSLLVYCIAPFVGFRAANYVPVVLNVFFIAVSFFLPESPMYYVLKDDESSARSALEYLGRSGDINNELKTMMERVQRQRNNQNIVKELLKLKCNRKSLFITVSLTGFQQGSGIIAIIVFTNTIFQYSGSSIPPEIASIIVGATFVIGAMVAPMFIDRYGRRMLLMISTAGLCVTMAGLGVYFYLKLTQPSSIESAGWLPLVLLVLAQLFYSFGLSIVPNTLSGELFSPKVRGLGPPLSISTGMISGFISTSVFSYVVVALGIHITFWLFTISNALAFLFVIFFVPETMGKSLIEIQDMLSK